MGRVQARTSFTETLTAVSEELLRLFGAQRLLLVIQAAGAERLFLWRAESSGRAPPVAGRYSEADRGERDAYVFPPPGEVWAATRARPGSALRILTIDGEPGPASGGPMLPPTFLTAEPFRRVLGAAISLGREWEDRLFLFEAGRAGARELRLLRAVVRQVGPVIYNVYLLRRLRGRTGALERAWLARELHDGIVQSLIGLEMHIDALRRRTGDAPATTATHLAEIQHLLRQEVAGVRELMQRMRPIHLDPSRLTEYLVDLVDKFQRETGIVAHFACELDEVALRPRVCTELARIVQEALANVRRHSGARNVVVRFESTNDHWRLTVADDGRGFGFSGHLSGAELEEARAGPAIIGERVRSIGGELAVESQPGQGARLQVTLPRVANA